MRVQALLGSVLLVVSAGASGETFELVDGTRLSGEVLERTDERLVVELAPPLAGRVEIPLDQIAPEAPASPGLFGTSFLAGWKREVNLGVNGSEGNTVNANARFGLDFGYEDEDKRWSVTQSYLYKSDDNDTTDHNAAFELQRDWLLPGSRWFVRAQYRWKWDDFKAWKHRLTAAGGPGYDLVKREAFQLRGLVGPALTRDFGDVNEWRSEGVVALETVWDLNETMSFNIHNAFFAEFTDLGQYRDLTGAALTISLAERPQLSLKLGVDSEYESNPEDGDKANDLTYYGTLGLGF
jgi:putative salt-induced outer membrane protein YdiY